MESRRKPATKECMYKAKLICTMKIPTSIKQPDKYESTLFYYFIKINFKRTETTFKEATLDGQRKSRNKFKCAS
jgi:hypothetical protein